MLPEIALYVGGTLFQSVVLGVHHRGRARLRHGGPRRRVAHPYVMGRDRMIPERVFGYIHPTWRTPAINVLLVGPWPSAVSFDLDMALALVNFGALVAFTFVNLSVIGPVLGAREAQQEPQGAPAVPGAAAAGAATIGALWINLEQSS